MLVFQGRRSDARFWALPGGIVEDGELVTEGLVREVAEETGLAIEELGRLAYAVRVDWRRPAHVRGREVPGYLATVWTFEVASWTGELVVDDPDGVVLEAAFLSVQEAVGRLGRTAWLSLAAAYLEGRVEPGSFHVERWDAAGRVSSGFG